VLLFAKAKVTGIAVLLAVYHALASATQTPLFIYGRAERLCLLHALAANGRFQLVTRKESFSALVASEAIHLAFWLPSKHSHIFQKFAFSSHFTLKNEREQCYPTKALTRWLLLRERAGEVPRLFAQLETRKDPFSVPGLCAEYLAHNSLDLVKCIEVVPFFELDISRERI
jgi:hypothetical protein